ncbi:unnamed protein product [Mycena citricolor]|uniref:Uncharacterized protein n=1 Tax=Mycena citricolor TaxID=2018698 RepID=A0AAD2HVG0_9AGAR|nr:unnamed protein product [Mycena citricolor]
MQAVNLALQVNKTFLNALVIAPRGVSIMHIQILLRQDGGQRSAAVMPNRDRRRSQTQRAEHQDHAQTTGPTDLPSYEDQDPCPLNDGMGQHRRGRPG